MRQRLGRRLVVASALAWGALGAGGCSLLAELVDDAEDGGSCDTAQDCPGEDGPCRVRTCVLGSCGQTVLPAGDPCGDGIAGFCDGAGRCDTEDGGCFDGEQNGNEAGVDCGGRCEGCANGEACSAPEDCASGACADGVCSPCGDEVACPPGTFCDPDLMQCRESSPDGAPCSSPSACANGQCVDGVCCNVACDGVCERCDAPDSPGACTPSPDGTDPDSECGTDVCGGASACRCDDRSTNGAESDVDCGGPVCGPCGDGLRCEQGSDCSSGVCQELICQVPVCGDGVTNGDDACDGDGAGTPGPTMDCDLDCTFAECGDGILNIFAGELCDGDGVGNGGETASCDVDCTLASCGDGVTNNAAGEACDGDGMGMGGETTTCDVDCSFQLCGDGMVNVTAGETCDGDGNGVGGETITCDIDCSAAFCGDGRINLTRGEQCDGDGFNNGGETELCDLDCTLAICGDDTVNVSAGEQCDDGDAESYDGCASTCRAPSAHLLISELVVAPDGSELVEIFNPTESAVALSTVWLADYATYYLLTVGGGTPASADFRLRFPAGATIGPRDFVVVSLASATDHLAAHGVLPDFDLDPLDVGAPSMNGTSTSLSALADATGMVVLFQWDGASDLVSDLDYVLYGGTGSAMDKSGVVVGGSSYSGDTPAAQQQPAAAPAAGASLDRCDTAEGDETLAGGNGQDGHDETSENLNVTTSAGATPSPGGAPSPGACVP